MAPISIANGLLKIQREPASPGDVNLDNEINLTDVIALLGDLFQGTHAVVCPGAADFNQDRRVNVSDAIAIAMYLFSGGTAPSADPGLTCAMK